jgi:hypothetical protein
VARLDSQVHEQTGLGTTLERVFAGTVLADVFKNIQGKSAKAS